MKKDKKQPGNDQATDLTEFLKRPIFDSSKLEEAEEVTDPNTPFEQPEEASAADFEGPEPGEDEEPTPAGNIFGGSETVAGYLTRIIDFFNRYLLARGYKYIAFEDWETDQITQIAQRVKEGKERGQSPSQVLSPEEINLYFAYSEYLDYKAHTLPFSEEEKTSLTSTLERLVEKWAVKIDMEKMEGWAAIAAITAPRALPLLDAIDYKQQREAKRQRQAEPPQPPQPPQQKPQPPATTSKN